MRKIFQIDYQLSKMLDLKNYILKAFSPFVFYHIRLIYKISNDNVIQSLDPVKNLTLLNN